MFSEGQNSCAKNFLARPARSRVSFMVVVRLPLAPRVFVCVCGRGRVQYSGLTCALARSLTSSSSACSSSAFSCLYSFGSSSFLTLWISKKLLNVVTLVILLVFFSFPFGRLHFADGCKLKKFFTLNSQTDFEGTTFGPLKSEVIKPVKVLSYALSWCPDE